MQGEYHLALEGMASTFASYGSHLLLLGDMISCLYMLGRFEDVYQLNKKLENEITIASPLCSGTTRYRALILCAKVYEEVADFDAALAIYKKVCTSGVIPGINSSKTRALAQILRISASLNSFDNTDSLIAELSRVRNEDKIVSLEVEHALILSDLQLKGYRESLNRLINFLKVGDLTATERNLLVFDFCEHLAVLNKDLFIKAYECEIKPLLISHTDLSTGDVYENAFVNIITDCMSNSSPETFLPAHIERSLSPMGFLRLLRIKMLFTNDETVKLNLKKQIKSSISSLPVKSKTSIERSFLGNFNKQTTELSKPVLHLSNGKVLHQGQEFECSDSNFKLLTEIQSLQTITKSGLFPTQYLISRFYGLDLSTSSLDRLRKSLKKLSMYLQDLTGAPHLIQCNKELVRTEFVLEMENEIKCG